MAWGDESKIWRFIFAAGKGSWDVLTATVYCPVAKVIIRCIKLHKDAMFVLLLTHTKLAYMQCLGLFMQAGL